MNIIECNIIVVCGASLVILGVDRQIKILDVCGLIHKLDKVDITGISLRCEINFDCIGRQGTEGSSC